MLISFIIVDFCNDFNIYEQAAGATALWPPQIEQCCHLGDRIHTAAATR